MSNLGLNADIINRLKDISITEALEGNRLEGRSRKADDRGPRK